VSSNINLHRIKMNKETRKQLERLYSTKDT